MAMEDYGRYIEKFDSPFMSSKKTVVRKLVGTARAIKWNAPDSGDKTDYAVKFLRSIGFDLFEPRYAVSVTSDGTLFAYDGNCMHGGKRIMVKNGELIVQRGSWWTSEKEEDFLKVYSKM